MDASILWTTPAVAALAGALVSLAIGGRGRRAGRVALARVLGVGAGFLAGCWWAGISLDWPPADAAARLVLILWPVAVLIETLGCLPPAPLALVWSLRLLLAAAAAPVLLHGSSYLGDADNPFVTPWTFPQRAFWLGTPALLLLGVWVGCLSPPSDPPGRSVAVGQLLALGGCLLAVLLSGYATSYKVGLPMAGVLAGVLAASQLWHRAEGAAGSIGLAVVGTYGLLALGVFFAGLHPARAAVLFAAPLLCRVAALLPVRPRGQQLLGWAAVLVLTGGVLLPLVRDYQTGSPSPETPPGRRDGSVTPDAYRSYGR